MTYLLFTHCIINPSSASIIQKNIYLICLYPLIVSIFDTINANHLKNDAIIRPTALLCRHWQKQDF